MGADDRSANHPAHSVRLLWGVRQRGRGPRPRLTAAEVARAAIGVADKEGLEGLSMRRIAERLDVGTMSLYRYVCSKDELLDLMIDTASGEAISQPPAGRTWRDRLEQIARANLRLFESHPWLLQVVWRRPALGPGIMAKYEAELAAIEGIGLSDVEMDLVLSTLLGYVHGAALAIVETARLSATSGMSDEEWWRAVEPAISEVFDADHFPLSARVGAAASERYGGLSDARLAFDFGLQRILDGIEAFVERRPAEAG